MNYNPRSRSWTLTINRDLQKGHDILAALDCYYVVWQEEKGAHKHIQAYVHFENAKTFSTMKKAFPGAHIEVCSPINGMKLMYELGREGERSSEPCLLYEGGDACR